MKTTLPSGGDAVSQFGCVSPSSWLDLVLHYARLCIGLQTGIQESFFGNLLP